MFNRLRRARHAVAVMLVRIAAWAIDTIDSGDVLTLIGLVLISRGLWSISRPAALIVPGAILVWYALPTRPPFISRSPDRKDAA